MPVQEEQYNIPNAHSVATAQTFMLGQNKTELYACSAREVQPQETHSFCYTTRSPNPDQKSHLSAGMPLLP